MKSVFPLGMGMLLCWETGAGAQPLLYADEAVRIALAGNFSLSLARDQTAQAELNRQTAVGPFLPSLSASVSHSGRLADSVTRQTTVGASLNWQIFDGFQSYNAYRRLQSTERAVESQERLAVESVLESVLNAYYGIVLQKQLLSAIRELLAVSQERARLAETRARVGAGTRLDELQSIAGLNEDSSSLLAGEASLRQAKVQLNQLLARDPRTEFDVSDSIPVTRNLPLTEWRGSLPENNASVLEARARQVASSSALKEAKGQWLPNLHAGLGYSLAPSSLNPPSATRPAEPTYNVTLSVPLFSQLRTRQAVGNARLELRQGEARLAQAEENARAEFDQNREKYEAALRRVDLEERNAEVAKRQSDAALERYRAGTVTPLELRDAQRVLLDARSRLVTARRDAEQATLVLRRLSGRLVSLPTVGQARGAAPDLLTPEARSGG